MLSFDHQTYCRLLQQSSKLAEDYRADCGLKKEKPVVLKPENIMPKGEVTLVDWKKEKEYSREDLKEILKKWEIKFFNWAKTPKLLEICIENKLI